MTTRTVSLALSVTALVSACAGDGGGGGGQPGGGEPGGGEPREDPQELADRVEQALGDLTTDEVVSDDLEYRIYDLSDVALEGDVTPSSCDAVDTRLQDTCSALYN